METSYKMKDEIKTYTEQRQLKPAGFKEPIKRKYEHRSDYPKPDTNIEVIKRSAKRNNLTEKEAFDLVDELRQPSPKCLIACGACAYPDCGFKHLEEAEPKCECVCHKEGYNPYSIPHKVENCLCEEAKTEWWGNWDNVHSHHKGNVHWIGKKGACPHCDEEDTYELPNGWQIDQFSRTHGYEPKPESWIIEKTITDLLMEKITPNEANELISSELERVRSEEREKVRIEEAKYYSSLGHMYSEERYLNDIDEAKQSLREELAEKVEKDIERFEKLYENLELDFDNGALHALRKMKDIINKVG